MKRDADGWTRAERIYELQALLEEEGLTIEEHARIVEENRQTWPDFPRAWASHSGVGFLVEEGTEVDVASDEAVAAYAALVQREEEQAR